MRALADESPAVHRRLSEARRAVESGRPSAALAPLSRALAADPDCAYAWFFRAGVRVLRGDLDGAAADLHALGRLPAATIVRYREFDAPSSLLFPAYLPAVDRLLKRRGAPAWGYVLRAFALREHHRFAEAVAAMERGAAAAPRDAGLRGLLSRVRFVNRFPKKGLADLDAALRLDPACGWLHAWRGEALRHLGRPEEALAALEKAIALEPRYFRAFAWRGGLRRSLADLDRALETAPPGEPSLSWIYNERMKARRAKGDVAGALDDLREAHALNTRYGWVRPGAPDAPAAEAELTRFLRRNPRHAWARAWRGLARLEAGRADDALDDLRGARGAWPLTWRGRALLQCGDASGALKDFTAALRADPRYAPAWGWRGVARSRLGKDAEALTDLTKAVALDPILAWCWAARGEILFGAGLRREAAADLDRALSLDPGNRGAQLIRQRISASFK